MISIWGLILAAICYVVAESYVDARNARQRREREEALEREPEERTRLRSAQRTS